MKRYKIQLIRGNGVVREEVGLTLLEVSYMANYSDGEFNDISCLEVGQYLFFGEEYLIRTE